MERIANEMVKFPPNFYAVTSGFEKRFRSAFTLSSAPSYDLLSTSPYLIVQHRPANPSDTYKISMQDKRIQPETIPRGTHAVTPVRVRPLEYCSLYSGERKSRILLILYQKRRPASRCGAACVCGGGEKRREPGRAVGQNRRCFCTGLGVKGVSSWWRVTRTSRVFSSVWPLDLVTVKKVRAIL